MEATRPVFAWFVSFSAVLNRARVGRNGRPPWDLRKGRPFKRALAPFGERVMHLPAGKHRSQLTSGYRHGFFVGVVDGSDEVYIGTEAGVVKSRSFQRLPEGAKSDKEGFLKIVGTPWNVTPSNPDDLPVRSAAMEERPIALHAGRVVREIEILRAPPPGPDAVPRKV